MRFHRFFRNNSLSITIFAIFFFCISGMSVAGWQTNNETLTEHGQSPLSYGDYIVSGEFIEGVFENWESEFLQMWALIILTVFLHQKNSADSKPMRGKAPQDTSSRYSIIRAATWNQRGRALGHAMYSHSLGLAMLGLFIVAFSLHAFGGLEAYNQEALQHGGEATSFFGYVFHHNSGTNRSRTGKVSSSLLAFYSFFRSGSVNVARRSPSRSAKVMITKPAS